jgi:hypothetical protein
MIFSGLRFFQSITANHRYSWRRVLASCLLTLMAAFSCLCLGMQPALAGFNDDHFDGNIFVLYGGNGSLVPAKVTLEDSLKRHKPAFLVFYVDDSSDCKQYATVVSGLQAYYGRVASFIPVTVDSISPKTSYQPTEPGYYYEGLVPQTVLIDQNGKVVLNEKGRVAFEKVDDAFREVFNLLPRAESPALKQRAFNEFNTELSQ